MQDSVDFIAELVRFNALGQSTIFTTQDTIPYYTNAFWSAAQRQSHALHEISYRACFKAQLPEFFINRLTEPGDVVFDPFMGRGTTLLQAALMARQAWGNDINPLAILLIRPRLRPMSLANIAAALSTINWSCGAIEREDLLAFYHPNTLLKLQALRQWLAERVPLTGEADDHVADWIRMIAISRLSGHSPGFFSTRSMPPNQAVSVKAQLRINQKLGVVPPERDVAQIIVKKSRDLLRDGSVTKPVTMRLHTGAAWEIPSITDASVMLSVTSPPFLDIVHYASDNWLRCWFIGIDPKTIAIDTHHTETSWTAMIYRVLHEQARILCPGGYLAFEVGEVRNGKLLLEKLVWQAARDLPFTRLGVMLNQQTFTKTANCWGITNGLKGTNSNRIVLLQRH